MSAPRVSIVVVNYNYAAFLRQAIDSALGQGEAPCEVIVVDDASTDGSAAIIADYGSRVGAVQRERNGGMSAAVNSGFARATGDIVMFVDADDYLYADAAARVADAFAPGVVQVQARLDLVDVRGQVEDVFPPYEARFDTGDVTAMLGARGRYATTVTTGLAFARDALARVMPIPERAFDRSADGYLATVVPLYGAVAAIETPIGAYRRHDSNHSGFQADMAKRARWRIEHDEHRYTALRDHAGRTGATIAADPGWHDATHLEQRLASLCFDPTAHPYRGDRRAVLGLAGARAALTGGMSLQRRLTHGAILLAAGLLPRRLGRTALAWKLERSSRPAVIDRLAGRLRRLMR